MKTFVVDFSKGRVYTKNNQEEFNSLFWSGLCDISGEIMSRDEIIDHFNTLDEPASVEFIGNEFGGQNIESFASVEATDLDRLGWYFDFDPENVTVVIRVAGDGSTWYHIINRETGSESDTEATGDDKKTVDDLLQLTAEGKLWEVSHSVTQ